MAREPFEGSEWGERDSPEGQPQRAERARPARPSLWRRRLTRLLPTLLIAAALLVGLVGLVGVAGFSFASAEQHDLDPAAKGLTSPLVNLHAAQRAELRRAMTAPVVLGVPRKQLEAIAECESHGDPRSIGGGGLYRGKYQFDKGTWRSVGGEGDPAKAPELEQDRRAAMLLKRSGSSPWPVCG